MDQSHVRATADLLINNGPSIFRKIDAGRKRAMIRQMAKQGVLPLYTIKVERYGGGHRWYCSVCDIRVEYLTIISWTNSPPPKCCPTCGGLHRN